MWTHLTVTKINSTPEASHLLEMLALFGACMVAAYVLVKAVRLVSKG